MILLSWLGAATNLLGCWLVATRRVVPGYWTMSAGSTMLLIWFVSRQDWAAASLSAAYLAINAVGIESWRRKR